nr:UvrD-like helicase, ATP-binding domain, P-loop containing nucleoside triphosphate hydrolase [Tanacetum cinerariifolium]GFA05943.1 UvrD-like helicase, ATP-binding domain, P-loop containing nucleoside triphosphate hydrolase [Tanacetum cinerariifolium]
MKKHDWLDERRPQSFPAFDEARHSVLCSELKQLYVAITRTRQRLWICENKEELSKPMFDYWKMKGLDQVRELDDSVVQAMRVASTPQEWLDRAGDTIWEKLAKASGLRAFAFQMRGTNHEAFQGYVREATGIFESIGKLELAASCYCGLGEYERAGKIYVTTCRKIDAAAECFSLAGCYSEVVEAYAKEDKFSDCFSTCKEGKLFDKGLQSLGCLDDLLLLEEESGHFLEAAELARSWGDVLQEAHLLEKAGHFKEAVVLLLWYVLFSSLWENGNRGWPLKQFDQKEKLCNKVKLLANLDSDVLYDFVCSRLKVLFDEQSSLTELKKDLDVSQKNESLRGVILLNRKMLDAHLHQNPSMYEWEDELPIDINEHCEDLISQNRVSVRTLVFYWNLWRENVVDIFKSFGINKDAAWIRNYGQRGVHRDGNCLAVDGRVLVLVMRSYWQSELLSVAINVLETLEGLFHKSKSNGSAFHQSTSLLHIFEVSFF